MNVCRVRLLLVFAFVFSLAIAKPLRAASEWITASTEHFLLYSTVSENKSRELLEDLERFRGVLSRGLSLPPGREPLTRVMAFGSWRDFQNYRPFYEGKAQSDVVGYHSPGPDSAYIVVYLGRGATEARRTIYHEYLHQLVDVHDLQLPLWLNEGLAEYYSTFRMHKGRVELGEPLEEHVKFLRQTGLLPLAMLAQVGLQSSIYNEGLRRGIFYAESWAAVHYLLCGKADRDNAEGLVRYIAMQRQPMPGVSEAARFQAAFGVDFETVDRELARYLSRGRYSRYSGEVTADPPPKISAFAPAGEAQVMTALTELQWRAQQSPKARLQLLQLAEANPTLPEPEESLGAIAWREGRWEEAVLHWRRAAERGSENPWVLVQEVARQVTDLVANQNLDYRMPDELATAVRARLTKAIQLSPDYGEAGELLALTEAFATTFDAANVNLVQRMMPRIPKPHRLLLALAILRWRVGDTTTSRKALDALATLPDPPPAVTQLAVLLQKRLVD